MLDGFLFIGEDRATSDDEQEREGPVVGGPPEPGSGHKCRDFCAAPDLKPEPGWPAISDDGTARLNDIDRQA